jgi:glutamate--cysteine ligase
VLNISRAGLARRAFRDGSGLDETRYLDPLEGIVASGRTQAEGLLERYHAAWKGSVRPAFSECVF